ncbi:hypothetical protein ABEB36_000563 [Hypothenemus hampei]|uniref:Protein-lysine N-methyltransferase SMYD4 n=1 Tax=Hypothenemus hampei TaxID=57062 RepID=A0ABD1FDK4_HYPHA
MDFLLSYYTDKFTNIEGNIFELFANLYSLDLSPVESWLEIKFKTKVQKDDSLSTFYRQEGNKCYARKDLLKSLELYTKSLCFATVNSREYGLALANRSAVSFEMKEFQNCLRDIDLCFKTSYPKDLWPKIYLRKAECYWEMGLQENLDKCIQEALIYLNKENISEKEKYVVKLNCMKKSTMKHKSCCLENHRESSYDLPKLQDGENTHFINSSAKLRLSYDACKGRYVTANKSITKGDVLFVEKAFIFAPVFKENKEFYSFKCYNCLKDIISSVPCHSCTLCVFCNEMCRSKSWTEYHRWECEGMTANIWYDLGIGFPAFKAVLKGVKSGFKSLKRSYKEDLKHFGNKDDNYPYFNRLVSHIYKSKNATPYMVMAAIIVTYLKKYTTFFHWFLQQDSCPKTDSDNLARHVGGLITKHIAQLSCNSSIIEHWTYSSSDILFPDTLISIACGMFPSVSMMNHSCKPNVTNFFICDTIIVKALEDIRENEEVFNCYGVTYRGMTKEHRQKICRSLYHFECKCIICSNPENEVDMLDSYLCPKCNGLIPEVPEETYTSCCSNCGNEYSIEIFRKINDGAQKYLESNEGNQLEVLLKCLIIREKILYKHHKDFEEVYYRLYDYYVILGDAKNMFKYFHLWLENEKARRGENSRGIGTKLYEAALAILHCLKSGQPKNCSNLKSFLQNVELMIKEAKFVLNLYYPEYITNRLSRKIQFISNKYGRAFD